MPLLARLLLATLLAAAPAWAREPPYLTPGQVDLLRLLPPPPAAESAQQAADMAQVLAAERARTPERVEQARVDAAETVFIMYGATLGPAFTPEALPTASRLFERIGETEDIVVDSAKPFLRRPRPFAANPALTPALPRSSSFSFPSGHATRSTIMAIVLSAMVPEKREAIFARQGDYAESRVIAGMHYPSDLVVGARAGTAIAALLFNDPAFMADFTAARREVRQALGLTD